VAVPPALLSHESTEHYTPQYILDAVIACMGAIDLDPCSNSREIPNVPAARHYTIQDNGLVQPWEGSVFINPPFGPGVEVWFSKLYQERLAGRTTEAIVLWKSATETAAWKTLTRLSCRVCFPSARIRFTGPGDSSGSTFSPALFYIGEGPERFEVAFKEIGAVWVVPGVPNNAPYAPLVPLWYPFENVVSTFAATHFTGRNESCPLLSTMCPPFVL